jgi:C-terminal peptidase prc
MKSWRRSTWLIPMLLASLACQVVYHAFAPTGGSQINVRAHRPALKATHTALPPTATPLPSPTPTSTPTPTAVPSPTIAPTASPVHFAVFEDLWTTIRDFYLYPDFNGLDWQAVYNDYYQQISAGFEDEDFYAAMDRMVASLGDDHSFFLDPQRARAEDVGFAGENDYVGIGIVSNAVPERKRVTIVVVFPDSPADRAGLKPHDNIIAVNGTPILDESGFRRDLLRGPAGSEIELTVQTPDQEPRQIVLTRERIQGPLPVPSELLASNSGKQIGYLLLTGFADETIDDQVAQALDELSRDAALDGLIIDNRQNSGGADDIARGVLAYFTSGVLGHFVDRDNEMRPFRVSGSSIEGSNRLPLVILIGPNTVSFGEIFAGILKDSGRAYLIGETTEGNMELLWGYDFPDGSRAWIARERFRPTTHPELDWEQSGIIPDLVLASNWDEVTLGTDPVITAALEHLDRQP